MFLSGGPRLFVFTCLVSNQSGAVKLVAPHNRVPCQCLLHTWVPYIDAVSTNTYVFTGSPGPLQLRFFFSLSITQQLRSIGILLSNSENYVPHGVPIPARSDVLHTSDSWFRYPVSIYVSTYVSSKTGNSSQKLICTFPILFQISRWSSTKTTKAPGLAV